MQKVEGSSPFIRSPGLRWSGAPPSATWRSWLTRRSAKPLFTGSSPVVASSPTCRRTSAHGERTHLRPERECIRSRVEHEPAVELRAKALPEKGEAIEISLPDRAAGLDFDSHDPTVWVFQHEIHLGPLRSRKCHSIGFDFRPGRLLSDLADDERLVTFSSVAVRAAQRAKMRGISAARSMSANCAIAR